MLSELNTVAVSGPLDNDDKRINELDVMINSNILLKKYKVAYQALEQYEFPFSFNHLTIPKYLDINNFSFPAVVKLVGNRLETILTELDNYRNVIHPTDKDVMVSPFSGRRNSEFPLFVWKNQEHNNVISRLLSGKEVFLNADIMKVTNGWEAVKFDDIKLDFVTDNPDDQRVLDKNMPFFDIQLTHMGDNHYRFKNKIYTVKTIDIPFRYSLDNERGGNSRSNKVYQKFKTGELLLSPYANWKVKLYAIKPSTVNFTSLEQFVNKVNLELGGHGSYIEQEDSPNDNYDYKSMQYCELYDEEGKRSGRGMSMLNFDLKKSIKYF